MSFHDYEGTGAYYASFSCEPGNIREDLAIVQRVLRSVQVDGVTAEELQQAKSKILSRVVRGGERPMGRMQALGYYWTYLKQYRTVDEDLREIDAVTVNSVREVLDRYPVSRFTTVALGPLEDLERPDNNGK